MEIYFPSKDRFWDCMTLRRMTQHKDLIPYRSYLVCCESQIQQYNEIVNKYKEFFPKGLEVYSVSDSLNLCQTRELLVYEQAKKEDPYILMVDDDCVFIRRENPESTTLRQLEAGEIVYMLSEIEKKMVEEGYVHVSVGDRFGNQNYNGIWRENMRSYRVYGFDCSVIAGEELHYDIKDPLCPRFVMEDFHMTLALIELGYPFAVYWEFCQNSPGSNTKGGLSSVRTLEVLRQSSEALQRLHPEVVKVVKKSTSHSWNGEERTDVNVQWKKAYCLRASERNLYREDSSEGSDTDTQSK